MKIYINKKQNLFSTFELPAYQGIEYIQASHIYIAKKSERGLLADDIFQFIDSAYDGISGFKSFKDEVLLMKIYKNGVLIKNIGENDIFAMSNTRGVLKTYKGSPIRRSKYGVGKSIGGDIYFHKQYSEDVIPIDIFHHAEGVLLENYPDFHYNCIRYSPKTQTISFQEAPDFDYAREPVVGDYVTISPNGDVRTGHSNYIWHHKWLWVKDDYTGFDVEESYNWSKQWLSVLQETSDGNGINRWNAQLQRYGLPL